MFDILYVIARPQRFFEDLRTRGSLPVNRAILVGLFCGWIGGMLGYLFTFFAWQFFQLAALAGLQDYALSGYAMYLAYLWFQVVAVPLGFLLHSVIAWILLRLFKKGGGEFREAVVLVGFARVASLWRIIPFLGMPLAMIHYAVLLYLGARQMCELTSWKALIIALVLSILAIDFLVLVQI